MFGKRMLELLDLSNRLLLKFSFCSSQNFIDASVQMNREIHGTSCLCVYGIFNDEKIHVICGNI